MNNIRQGLQIVKIDITQSNFNRENIDALAFPLIGLSTAKAVSRWLPTAAARVRAWAWSSGICGGQIGAGAGFLRVRRFPLPIFIPQNSPSLQSSGADTKGQK
jgi:hypothetical protein